MAKETEGAEKTTKIIKTKTGKGWKIAKRILLVIVILGLAGVAGYFYKQYDNLRNHPPTLEEIQKQQDDAIISKVSKLYSLPDEKPLIFLVKDKNKLTDVEKKYISDKVENGDYQLTYTEARVAIVYRPSSNKIVDVRILNVIPSIPRIAILGPQANRDNVAQTIENNLKDEVKVTSKVDSKNSYSGIVVVDLSNSYTDQVNNLAKALGGKVGSLPEGESAPRDTEIVIIVGTDQSSQPTQ